MAEYHQITQNEIEVIMKTDSFGNNAKRIKSSGAAKSLNESRALLASAVMLSTRFKSSFSTSSKQDAIKISYIAKSVIQEHYNQSGNLEYIDEITAPDSLITPVASNERLTPDEAQRISELFLPKSQEFVRTLLTFGDDTTKQQLNMATKKLNKKVKQLILYISNRKETFNNIVIRNAVQDKQTTVMAIEQFFNLIDLEVDGKQLSNHIKHQLLDQSKPYEDALDKTRYSSVILDDFYAAPKADQYAFCNELRKQSEQLWNDTRQTMKGHQ